MGLFGFLKKKGEAVELQPEEPEFLREVDTSTPEKARSVKEQVEPELALWLSNGTAATGLKELASALRRMKASDYKEQANPERNEIAEWVQEILNDSELAKKLRQAKGRIQAANAVEKEIKALKAAKKASSTWPLLKKTGKKEEAKLPEIPEMGYELQDIPLLNIPAEKPQMAVAKGWIFSRLLGKKPKKESQEQLSENIPILPVPELTEEPKAAKSINEITKKLSKKASRIAAMKAEKEMKEKPQLEDFQNDESAEPLTEEAPGTKKKRKGFMGFLFKRKENNAEEQPKAEAAQPTAFEMLPKLPDELNTDKPESPAQNAASEFEPEPQHAKSKKRARQHEEYDDSEAIGQERELERTEKELLKQEEELNNKRLELTRKRYELIKQKGELESKKFEEFIRKHKNRNEKEETIVREGIYSQDSIRADLPMQDLHIPHGGIVPDFRLSSAYGKDRLEELLEEAKQHIRENKMEEAQNALHEVQSVFDTVYMTNNEKKQIEYDILEVEADLKLASLK